MNNKNYPKDFIVESLNETRKKLNVNTRTLYFLKDSVSGKFYDEFGTLTSFNKCKISSEENIILETMICIIKLMKHFKKYPVGQSDQYLKDIDFREKLENWGIVIESVEVTINH